MGSASTGKLGKKYPAYHCDRNHTRVSASKVEFEKNVMNRLKTIKINPKYLKSFEAVLIDTYRKAQKDVTKQSSDISQNIADLEKEKEQAVQAFIGAESDLIKKELTKKIESIEERILSARNQRTNIEVTEDELTRFIKFTKILMEHLHEIIQLSENNNQKQALFELVFEDTPTYQEIVNGTPNLSAIFQFFSGNKVSARVQLRC